jgi:metallo-beta-lactamase family protein
MYKRGKLLIPSFSVGRTQEIVYVLNELYNDGRLERVPVYVDSPLSANATQIFRRYADTLNEHVRDTMRYDDDPFGFNSLRYITDLNDSKALNRSQEPCIVISASGMLEAGRIKHHVSNHIDDPSTTILIVGYCTPSSLGARIQDPSLRYVSIFGYDHRIRAQVTKIEGFSGHGDYREMIDYFSSSQDITKIRKTFIVHGESSAQDAFKDHLYEAGFRGIEIPEKGYSVEL